MRKVKVVRVEMTPDERQRFGPLVVELCRTHSGIPFRKMVQFKQFSAPALNPSSCIVCGKTATVGGVVINRSTDFYWVSGELGDASVFYCKDCVEVVDAH